MLYAAKPAFQRSLQPVAAGLAARGVSADALTGAAVAVSFAAGVALAGSAERPELLLLAIPAGGLRTILNVLDGLVARRTGRARPWGEVLNELGDRVADLALFGGLALAGLADPRLASAAVVAMLLASHAGVLAKAVGAPRLYSGLLGKPDRLALLAVAALAAQTWSPARVVSLVFAALLVGSLVTLAQRLRLLFRAVEVARTASDD